MTTRHPHGPGRPRPGSKNRTVEEPGANNSAADGGETDECAGWDTRRPSARIPRALQWVRVTCPTCDVVRVRVDRVVVRNCVDDQTWSYRARCSGCDTTFLAPTPEPLALAAISAGVAVETWTWPRPSPRRPGAPLHAVDALELHLALMEVDWFERLAEVEPFGDR